VYNASDAGPHDPFSAFRDSLDLAGLDRVARSHICSGDFMSPSPAEYSYRLPSEDEIKRILKDSAGKKGSQTTEGKAKSNLLRSLDWAYTGLPQDTRQKLVYTGAVPLGKALENKTTISDNDVLLMRACLVDKSPTLQHPGNSLKLLDSGQKTMVTTALQWFETTNDEIAKKTYDVHLDFVFPADQGRDTVKDPQTLDERRAEVAKRLKRAKESVSKLLEDGKVVIAGYHPFVKSGGGGGPNSVDLKPDFFTSYSDKDRRATLVHEATHTIPTKDMHTEDYCYIHQPQFSTVKLSIRYLNASHFEALIRLINGEKLALAVPRPSTSGSGTKTDEATPENLATEIVTAAWIQAWRWHGDMAKLHQTDTTTINVKRGPALDVIDQAHVLGLSWAKVEKGYLSTDVSISNSDLAFLENRAGKLGVLMGVVEKAADATVNKTDLAFTSTELADRKLQNEKVEKLLQKVIEMEGALRKTSNNKKTLDMLMALADKKVENEGNASIGPLVKGRYNLFLSTYPRKK
jgi:hypothetical protein